MEYVNSGDLISELRVASLPRLSLRINKAGVLKSVEKFNKGRRGGSYKRLKSSGSISEALSPKRGALNPERQRT